MTYNTPGRKKLPPGEKGLTCQIRLKPRYREYYQTNLNKNWLEAKIEEEMNPTPTEKDLFVAYAVEKGVHPEAQTITALLEFYEEEKYNFGWEKLIDIFKQAEVQINTVEEERAKQGRRLSATESKVIQKAVVSSFKQIM